MRTKKTSQTSSSSVVISNPEPAKTQLVIETKPGNKPTKDKTTSEKEHLEWLRVIMEEDREILDELAKH